MNRRSFLTRMLAAIASGLARLPFVAAALPPLRRWSQQGRPHRPQPVAAAFGPPASKRQEIDLDDGWRFYRADASGADQIDFDDSGWDWVDLPHTWNNLDGQRHTNYYRGVGWYRRHYTVDGALAGMKFYLQFDGANLVTDVYVNGSYVGEHRGGYARFRFDITPYLHVDADNLIAVKVNNASNPDVPPLDADYTFFGGLYRPVHLLLTDPLQLETLDYGSSGVYITPTNITAASADLEVATEVVNATPDPKRVTVTAYVVDADGNLVATLSATQLIDPGRKSDFSLSTTIANPRPWDGRADPYLYTAHVAASDGSGGDTVNDLVSHRFGFRSFSVNPDKGLFLNGSYLDLHGVNRHQDRLNKGWALAPADHEEDFSLIEEIGATAIRLAHYQHDQHFYDLADQNGIVVWAELPLIDRITGSDAFCANAQQQLLELIRQNYNHPAILFWSISNEITLRPGPDPNPLLEILADLVAREDVTRLSTLASAAGDRNPTTTHTDVVAFNRYYGWYYGSYDDFPAWADDVYSRYSPRARAFGTSEYGAGASICFHSDKPARMDHTEEYQNLFHEAHWRAMKSRPFLWGKFVWNMFDFASARRNEGDTPGRNDKGLVTYDRRTRKDAFYWYKANWSTDPVLYITSRRFTDRTQPLTEIKVYSNADSVEVRLNGNSLGPVVSPDRAFVWSGVTLVAGPNLVEAFAIIDGESYGDRVTWTLNV